MRKRVSAIVLVLLFCLTFCLSACGTEDAEVDSLIVYNWADYIYEYEDDFKAYYKELTGRDINVTYVTFDTNETMLTKIEKGDSVVDVMCPSDYAIQKLLERGLIKEMNYFDEDKFIDASSLNGYIHNSENVDSKITEQVGQTFASLTVNGQPVNINDYFVPYMYGTIGILYSREYFEEIFDLDLTTDEGNERLSEIMNKANWGIMFNDDGDGNVLSEELKGRIYMKDSIRDSYAATIFYMKENGTLARLDEQYGTSYSSLPASELINAVDDNLLGAMEDILKKQKDDLYGYEVDFGKNELIQGIAYVDLAWSGDALYAVDESFSEDYHSDKQGYEDGDYTLGFYLPHTTGNIWFDGWVIPKTCKNEMPARIFINFLNDATVAVNNMDYIGYSSAVSPEAIQNDKNAMATLYDIYEIDATDDDAKEELVKDYFFKQDADGNCLDTVSYSNWRYPFLTEDTESGYDRTPETTLGVMQDFGENNNKVSVMWENVRSTGITAMGLLLYTLLAIAVAVGVILLVYFVNEKRATYKKQ